MSALSSASWVDMPLTADWLQVCFGTLPPTHPIMKISLSFTHHRGILGVYDFLLSDESSRSYSILKIVLAIPSVIIAVGGCFCWTVQKTSNKACASIIKHASHGSRSWIKASCSESMHFCKKYFKRNKHFSLISSNCHKRKLFRRAVEQKHPPTAMIMLGIARAIFNRTLIGFVWKKKVHIPLGLGMKRYHFCRSDPIQKILSIGQFWSDTSAVLFFFFFFFLQCRIYILLCVTLLC